MPLRELMHRVTATFTTRSSVRFGFVHVVVVIYASCIFLPFLGSRTLTPHEVMAVHPAQRMLADGQWVVPRYGGAYWLDKPPLVNWMTAGSLAVAGGFSEFASRLPTAICAVALCMLLSILTARLYRAPLVSLLAGLVQATCVYMFIEGRLAEPDMPFALMLACAHAVLLWNLASRRGRHDLLREFDKACDHPAHSPLLAAPAPKPLRLSVAAACLFHMFAGLAVLAKGPAALAFLAASIFTFAALCRSWQPLRAVLLTPGVSVFFAIAGGWHIAAYLSVGPEALHQWTYNNLVRFVGKHRLGQSDSFFSYFYNLPWLMLPWTAVLALGTPKLWTALKTEIGRPDPTASDSDRTALTALPTRAPNNVLEPNHHAHLYLLSWFFGGFAFLMLCQFKHKHYLLPILPPLTILTAVLLSRHIEVVGVRQRRAYMGAFITAIPLFLFLGGYIVPSRDHRRTTVEFVRDATSRIPKDEVLYVLGMAQAPVSPYINHANCVYLDEPEEVTRTLNERGEQPMWVLTIRRHLPLVKTYGFSFEQAAGELARKKHPADRTIILGRLRKAAASAPVPSTVARNRQNSAERYGVQRGLR